VWRACRETKISGFTMGHHISAVVLKGPFDEAQARSFDLKVMRLTAELTLFPLDAGYCDHWSGKLGISGFKSHRRS
jgi:hypothetical protein